MRRRSARVERPGPFFRSGLSYRRRTPAVAADNLGLGRDVVADSVNPLRITREAWRGVAERAGSACIEIEVVPNLELPSWSQVVGREYDPWDRPRLVVDTAGQTEAESRAVLERSLSAEEPKGRTT